MKKKFIINVGCARSGTTAMESLFEKLPFIETPLEKKEIQAFSKPTINMQDYLNYFSAHDSEFYFESSPPYVHAGIEKFHKVIKNIKTISEFSQIKIVFNLRSLAKRAFSHYWHDISRHHSLYGKDWGVRRLNDSNRYKELYSDSFFEALSKDYNKFLPDIMGMITLAGKELGWDNVRIILQKQLDYGIGLLCEELSIPLGNIKSPRIQGCRAPCFLKPGDYKISNDNQIVRVRSNTILRCGYNGVEVIDADKYPVNEILEASFCWTKNATYSSVSAIFGRYFSEQSKLLRHIPENLFLTNLNIDEEIFKLEDLNVEDEAIVEQLNG